MTIVTIKIRGEVDPTTLQEMNKFVKYLPMDPRISLARKLIMDMMPMEIQQSATVDIGTTKWTFKDEEEEWRKVEGSDAFGFRVCDWPEGAPEIEFGPYSGP
jgi:hypothetical protein